MTANACNKATPRLSTRFLPLTRTGLWLGAALFGGGTQGSEPTHAVVVGIHPAATTRSFAAAHGIPEGQAHGGCYALVRLMKAHASASRSPYALVYVPPDVKVRRDDEVVIAAGKYDLVADPGKGVVVGVTAGEVATSR